MTEQNTTYNRNRWRRDARRDQLCEILVRSTRPLTAREIAEFMPPIWHSDGVCDHHRGSPTLVGYYHLGDRCFRLYASHPTDVNNDLATLNRRGLVERAEREPAVRWRYIGPRTELNDLVLAQLDFDITEDSP